MSTFYTCPQGHTWEDVWGDDSISPDQTVTCPVCGAATKVPVSAEPPGQTTLIQPIAPITPPAAGESPTLDIVASPSETAAYESLIRAGVLETPTLPKTRPTHPDERPGPAGTIGDYEIVGELGRGGMGVVYKARHEKLSRTVALKMLLAGGHAGKSGLARFAAEARAIAHLQHPNIVQVYEIGEHEDKPFFAMEMVEGTNLLSRLRDNPPPVREAARLVATLARAMHAVHEKGIIHRDLKPANVLLTRDGTPKITDFGLAKRLDESGQTKTGDVMGTPSYMAPEQAKGLLKEIGPVTDVYALGAILYELLTARPPFRAETAMDTMLQVLYVEPVPPARLCAKMPRDLETICLKCLEKDTTKRYPSAAALADDLDRFLNHQPILARPVGVVERTRKWAKRRPALAALVTLALLTVVGGVMASVAWNVQLNEKNRQLAALAESERDKAEKARIAEERATKESERATQEEKHARKGWAEAERQRAEAVANFQAALEAVQGLLTEVSQTELLNVPHMEGVRRKLLDRALTFHRRFLQKKSDEPAVRQLAGKAYVQVGDIYRQLRELPRADEALEQAVGMFRQLVHDYPKEAEYRRELALAYFVQGQVFRKTGRLPQAEKAYGQALKLQEVLTGEFPGKVEYQRDEGHTVNDLAFVLRETKRPADAQQLYERALKLQEMLAAKTTQADDLWDLAGSRNDLGTLLRAQKKYEEAEQQYVQARNQLQLLVDDNSHVAAYRVRLGAVCNNLGNLHRDLREWKKAEEALELAAAHRKKLTTEFPSYLAYRQDLAGTYNSLAAIKAVDDKRLSAAQQDFKSAADLLRDLVTMLPTVPDFRSELAAVLDNWAAVLIKAKKDLGTARALLTEAGPHHDAVRQSDADREAYRQHLRSHYTALADLALLPGEDGAPPDHAAAAKAAAELPRLFPDAPNEYLRAARILAQCATLSKKEPKQSLKYADAAMTNLQKAVERGFDHVEQLENASVLRVLEMRSDYKKLLAELKEKKATKKPR